MDRLKDIIKIIIIALLIILTIIFMVNMLPFLIILIIVFAIYNYFKSKRNYGPEEDSKIVVKEKKKTKDMKGIDLALHISEKTNKKSKNIDR